MRIDVAFRCATCRREVPDGAHYCASCGHGQPNRSPAAHDQVELVDPRVRPPLLPTQPSPRSLVIAAVVLVVLLLATVPVLVIRAVFFGPGDAVRNYFGALAARNADSAWTQLDSGDVSRAGNPLLDDAALAGPAYHPPTGFVLTKLTVDNADAVASVTYTIDGNHIVDQVKVHRGRAVNLFQRWHVSDGLRPLLVQAPQFTGIQVGGAYLGPGASSGQLSAFPGAYVVSLPPDPLLSAQPVTVVAGTNEGRGLTLEVQSSARTEIERQVREYVDKCAASTALAPAGCPFGETNTYYYDEPVRWKVLSYPTLQEVVSNDGQVVVSSVNSGAVQLTGAPSSYGPPSNTSFSVAGVVSQSNGSLAFHPQQ